jgi:hypothetical protein
MYESGSRRIKYEVTPQQFSVEISKAAYVGLDAESSSEQSLLTFSFQSYGKLNYYLIECMDTIVVSTLLIMEENTILCSSLTG